MLWCSPRTSCWWIGWSYQIFFLCTWWLNTSKTWNTYEVDSWVPKSAGGWGVGGKCHILSCRSCTLQVWVELWMSSWRNWGLLFITIQDSADNMAKTGGFAGGTLQFWDSTGLSKHCNTALLGFFMLSWHCALHPTWKDNSWVREVCPLSPWFSEKTANKPGNYIWVNHKTTNL